MLLDEDRFTSGSNTQCQGSPAALVYCFQTYPQGVG